MTSITSSSVIITKRLYTGLGKVISQRHHLLMMAAQRQKYGHSRLSDTDYLMSIFLASGKKQIVYWAENIKNSAQNMTYDTFKIRVREYLKRTKQSLSPPQIERIRLSDREVERFANLYLQVSKAPMNKAQFFEQYIISPPYETVPSYEQFKIKLVRQLKHWQMQLQPSRPESSNSSADNADDAAILRQLSTTENESKDNKYKIILIHIYYILYVIYYILYIIL